MSTIKTHGGEDLYRLDLKVDKAGELQVNKGPHLAGHDCPLCKKMSSVFFNLSGAMGDTRGAWAYYGCRDCHVVIYNPSYFFKSFSPTAKEYQDVINPMIQQWNKLVEMTLK